MLSAYIPTTPPIHKNEITPIPAAIHLNVEATALPFDFSARGGVIEVALAVIVGDAANGGAADSFCAGLGVTTCAVAL